MKRLLLLLLVSFAKLSLVCAQNHTYTPMLNEGKKWVYRHYYEDKPVLTEEMLQELDGMTDEEIMQWFEQNYQTFYYYSYPEYVVSPGQGGHWVVSMDEDRNGQKQHVDYNMEEKDRKIYVNNYLAMDFDVQVGDEITYPGFTVEGYIDIPVGTVEKDEIIRVKGRDYRRLTLVNKKGQLVDYWVEGIGSRNSEFMCPMYFSNYPILQEIRLEAIYQDGELIFENDDFETTNVVHGDEVGIIGQSLRPGPRQLHDLQGRRLTHAPARGMYIQDGKVTMK